MSIKSQGSVYLIGKLYIAMASGFMQRNGVSKSEANQITKQFEASNNWFTVQIVRPPSQNDVPLNLYGTSIYIENKYKNYAI